MKNGFTLIETVIAIGALSLISILATMYLYQTFAARDTTLALAEATEVANTVIHRIDNSVKQAHTMTVTATTLMTQGDTICELYTLNNQRIYYDTGPVPCPVAATLNNPITNATANITNAVGIPIVLFTPSPLAGNTLTVTTEIRVRVRRPFGDKTVTLKESISRRR